MDWITCALVILMAVTVDADCSSGVQACSDKYMQNVYDHALDHDALCNDIDGLVKCVFSQGCHVGSAQKQWIIDSTKDPMAYFNCSFTMADLIYGHENSASLLSPINTTLIIMMSFILLILNSKILLNLFVFQFNQMK